MRNFLRKHFLAATAGGALVLLLFSIVSYYGWNRGLETVPAKRGPIAEAVYALGTVKSQHIYKLKAGIPMGIGKVSVSEGEKVHKGQLLLQADSGSSFRAPFDGTITSLYVNPNELVITGSPLLVLQDLKQLYVELSLDQESALRMKPGQNAELSFESIRGFKYEGRVERVYPMDGQFLVRLSVEKLPDGVLPDMTADVAIEVDRKEDVLLIPLAAVKSGKVRVQRYGERLRTEQVKIGIINGEWGELLDGDIQEGDRLVLNRRK